jgi:hypothetical protein
VTNSSHIVRILIIINKKDNFIMNSDECKAINQGLLSKGLSTTIVSVAMSTQEMINRYKGGDDSFNDLVKIFNSNEFEIFS